MCTPLSGSLPLINRTQGSWDRRLLGPKLTLVGLKRTRTVNVEIYRRVLILGVKEVSTNDTSLTRDLRRDRKLHRTGPTRAPIVQVTSKREREKGGEWRVWLTRKSCFCELKTGVVKRHGKLRALELKIPELIKHLLTGRESRRLWEDETLGPAHEDSTSSLLKVVWRGPPRVHRQSPGTETTGGRRHVVMSVIDDPGT